MISEKFLGSLLYKIKILLLFLVCNFSLLANEKLSGQEIIERLDRTLAINDGLTRASLSIKKGNHQTHFWKVFILKQGDDILFTFEVTHKKVVSKLLSIKRGQKLIYYNVLSGNFYQIEQMEKLQSLLGTSFSYLDLSNYQYEANYNPESILSPAPENLVLKMSPISFPSYKYLELSVDNSNYSPRKIDFFSPEGLLTKTLKLKFGKLKVKDDKSVSEISTLTKLEMTDNSTNHTSILEFIEWDKNINPDKIIYEMRTMYEK